jgi:hypothetical protein
MSELQRELRWWNGYFNTYHSFDDLILLRGHYRNSFFNWRAIRTVSWHTGKSAQDIYATALTILQVGLSTIQLPPNPDFNSLSPEEKDRIYQDLHHQIDILILLHISFAHRALSCGDIGPALESGLADQEFVIAFVCRFQVILSHGYINFPTIDDLRLRRKFGSGKQNGLRMMSSVMHVFNNGSWRQKPSVQGSDEHLAAVWETVTEGYSIVYTWHQRIVGINSVKRLMEIRRQGKPKGLHYPD